MDQAGSQRDLVGFGADGREPSLTLPALTELMDLELARRYYERRLLRANRSLSDFLLPDPIEHMS